MPASYFPEDYDRVDYVDIIGPEDLRPFLAHVIGPHSPAARRRFLRALEDIAEEMADLAQRHPNLTGPQWQLLEIARLENSVVVDGKHRRPAEALADAGLVTLTYTDDGTVTVTVAPKAEGS